MRASLRAVWEAWKLVAHAIGKVQARIVFSLLYIVLIGPVALVVGFPAQAIQFCLDAVADVPGSHDGLVRRQAVDQGHDRQDARDRSRADPLQ